MIWLIGIVGVTLVVWLCSGWEEDPDWRARKDRRERMTEAERNSEDAAYGEWMAHRDPRGS